MTNERLMKGKWKRVQVRNPLRGRAEHANGFRDLPPPLPPTSEDDGMGVLCLVRRDEIL